MKSPLLSLALIAAFAGSMIGQTSRPPESRSAVIAGRVLADGTGDPIRNARVALLPASEAAIVLTDAEGAFRISVPAARYTIVASKTGYARAEQSPALTGQPIEVRLRKGAAVAGTVVDDRGEPVIGVQVAAATPLGDGKTRTVATTETDDRGEYRLGGLPGEPVIVGVTTFGVVGRNGSAPRVTYYPAAATPAEAQALQLQPGEERPAVDVTVPIYHLSGMPEALFMLRFLREEMRIDRRGLARPDPVPPATGIVRGRVRNPQGAPIPYAQVYLFGRSNAYSRAATSDEGGRFELTEVPAGRFLLSAVKSGFAQIESGEPVTPFQMGRATSSPTPADLQSGRAFELADGEMRDNVDLQMAGWGAVSGTVRDEYGDALQGVSVDVLRVEYRAGRLRLVPAGASRLTDDLGRYRLHGITPGRYIVSAAVGQVQSEDLPGYGRSYFPGTPDAADAQYVAIGLQDIGGVDFALSRAPTARIAGVVLGPTGQPGVPGSLTLVPSQRSSSVASVPVGARIAADGTFEFPNVAPGRYVVQAYRGRLNRSTESEFGAATVSVGGADVTGVTVRTSPGSSITGRIRFDIADRTLMPKPSDLDLVPMPVDFDLSPPGNWASAEIHRDWTFELAGLNGSRRLHLVRTPPGLALKEIRVNGADMTDMPIALGTRAESLTGVEVVLTDRPAVLRGTVVDDRQRPVSGARVVVFSTDRARWYFASRYTQDSRASAGGAFTVTGLPSGNYYVSALYALPAGGEDAWQEPRFLEALIPGASTVSVAEAQQASVTLRIRAR